MQLKEQQYNVFLLLSAFFLTNLLSSGYVHHGSASDKRFTFHPFKIKSVTKDLTLIGSARDKLLKIGIMILTNWRVLSNFKK